MNTYTQLCASSETDFEAATVNFFAFGRSTFAMTITWAVAFGTLIEIKMRYLLGTGSFLYLSTRAGSV